MFIFSCSPIKTRNLRKIYPEEDRQIDRNLERQILDKSSKNELNDSTVIRHIQISEARQGQDTVYRKSD
jgi:hypothetical protein